MQCVRIAAKGMALFASCRLFHEDRRPPVASQAETSPYLMIRNAIISQELPPRAQLVESALAKKYNVSRTPIREALRRLETEALVARSGSRMQVPQSPPDQILHP